MTCTASGPGTGLPQEMEDFFHPKTALGKPEMEFWKMMFYIYIYLYIYIYSFVFKGLQYIFRFYVSSSGGV